MERAGYVVWGRPVIWQGIMAADLNVADLKLFWFSSLGPFGLLWGSGCICRWGAKNSCYGRAGSGQSAAHVNLGYAAENGENRQA